MFEAFGTFLTGGAQLLLLFVVLPVVIGAISLLLRKHIKAVQAVCGIYAVLAAALAVGLYFAGTGGMQIAMAGLGLDMLLAVTPFSAVFVLLCGIVFMLVTVYTLAWFGKSGEGPVFLFYLLVSYGMVNGALLSDNLGIMLFFWEGLLCTLIGILLMRTKKDPKTMMKALTLSGTADLLLMGGIILTGLNAGTFAMSGMEKLSLSGTGALGFILMFLGAVGKAGCMPFHSWIPDAADDAPTPFLVAFPGAFEKFLGIYLGALLVYRLYDVAPGSGMSIALMTLGTLTLLFAVAMALIQKDMRRLLAYHAISQVGYMVLGLGTCLPIGIIGALTHMINHVVYKSGLFMTAGSVEKCTGTTDLHQFGGLARRMPVTMVCFIVCGLSISGVPPFNGFFSKELIFDAALESNWIFYLGALLGAVMTAVSFLKMGRAAFSGKERLPQGAPANFKENPVLVAPMVALSLCCLVLGVCNFIPIDLLFGSSLGITQSYAGWPESALLVTVSVIALLVAVADHIYGSKKTGDPLNAADHIHYAPGLKQVYALAEKKAFDPYVWMMKLIGVFALVCEKIEHGVSWVYDVAIVRLVKGCGNVLHKANTGRLSQYIGLALAGVICMIVIIIISHQ